MRQTTLHWASLHGAAEPVFSADIRYAGKTLVYVLSVSKLHHHAMHNIEPGIFAIVFDPILNAIGFNKLKLNPQTIQQKIGFMGEPMTIGFVLGGIIGILGNLSNLGSMAGWGSVLTAAVATAAVMAIFPKITGFFAQALRRSPRVPVNSWAIPEIANGISRQ